MSERTCLFCGGEITPQNILFSYKGYRGGASYEDELRTSFLSACASGLESKVGEASGGTIRYKALYFEPSSVYDMELDKGGLPINMSGVPLNKGLTPKQLERKRNGEEDLDTGEVLVTDASPRTLTTRVCPHCHCELPRNYGLYPIINVALIGGKAAGKTAFLLNMTQRLSSDLSKRNLGTASLVGESQKYFEILETSYLELGGSTIGTPADALLFPFVFEYTSLTDASKSCYVTIYDMAGESMKNADALGEQMGLRNSQTVLMMLDSNMLNEGMYFNEARQREAANQSDDFAATDGSSCYNSPIDTFLAERIASYKGAHIFDHVCNVIAVTTKIDQVLCSATEKQNFRAENIMIKQNLESESINQGTGARQTNYMHHGGFDYAILNKVETEVLSFYSRKGQTNLREKIQNAFANNFGANADNKKVNVYMLAASTYTRHKEMETANSGCIFQNDYTNIGKKHRIIEPFLLVLAGRGRLPPIGRYIPVNEAGHQNSSGSMTVASNGTIVNVNNSVVTPAQSAPVSAANNNAPVTPQGKPEKKKKGGFLGLFGGQK